MAKLTVVEYKKAFSLEEVTTPEKLVHKFNVARVVYNAEVLVLGRCGYTKQGKNDYYATATVDLKNSDMEYRRGERTHLLIEGSKQAIDKLIALCNEERPPCGGKMWGGEIYKMDRKHNAEKQKELKAAQ
jgi:hypothetical protein